MRYSQLIVPRASEVVEAPTPDPSPGEVLVRVMASGVCASELHPWADGRPGYRHRFGHEPMGEVVAAGPEVIRLGEGGRVTGLFQGAYADVCLAKEAELLPLPDVVSEENALGEPLTCLVNAQRRTPVELADRVAVIGLGYMGLGMLQPLKLRDLCRIVAIDVREEARAAAMALGADESYHPSQLPDAYRITSIGDWQSDRGFDVAEGTGTQPGLALAGEMVRAHGAPSVLGYDQGGSRQVEVGTWNWKATDVSTPTYGVAPT